MLRSALPLTLAAALALACATSAEDDGSPTESWRLEHDQTGDLIATYTEGEYPVFIDDPFDLEVRSGLCSASCTMQFGETEGEARAAVEFDPEGEAVLL